MQDYRTCHDTLFHKQGVESFSHKMSSKSLSLSVSPGTVLSVFCLLLYSAGFIRIEVKFNDHEQRLVAVEKIISHIRQGMADASIKGTPVYFRFDIQAAFVFHYFSFAFPSYFVVRQEHD